MKYFVCDMCGSHLDAKELRYVLKMNIFAAYSTMEIEHSDLEKDHESEIRKLINEMERMDPRELEEDIFKKFNFDLCPRCQEKFIKNPLGNRSDAGKTESGLPPFDVDDFLRHFDD